MTRSLVQNISFNFAIASLAASFMPLASAQEAAGGLSRAEVKAETLAAAREHLLTPAGEGSALPPQSSWHSTITRRQVAAETLQEAKEGGLIPAGDAVEWPVSRRNDAEMSTRFRADVIAETRAAVKAHELMPAGEGSYPVRNR